VTLPGVDADANVLECYPILRFTEVPGVTVRIVDPPGEPEEGGGEHWSEVGTGRGSNSMALRRREELRVSRMPASRELRHDFEERGQRLVVWQKATSHRIDAEISPGAAHRG
jgi:hypothetical protein